MGNGFSVQIGDFVAAAPKITTVGDEFSEVAARHTSDLDALGNFWGTTAHGPEFGDQYQKAAENLLKLAQACGVALRGVGFGLQHMGDTYKANEAQVAKIFGGGS